jgi:glycosyltransferase involved in cell wall biosynthesis
MSHGDTPPLVSVCVPAFNGADAIFTAVDSALDQDYPNLEVLVVDDASTDETVALLERRYADRVRVIARERRSGHNRNWNATVQHSHGAFIKFLHQDDRLAPDTVSTMAELLIEDPSVGMVFSRRRVERSAAGPAADEWVTRYGAVHEGFRDLGRLNDGAALLAQVIEAGALDNWVGEPSTVMVRRACLERVGGFSHHVRQATDTDLWLRLMAHYRVAFVDRELAVFRLSPESLTATNKSRRLDWLDQLWVLEDLWRDDAVRRMHPELRSRLRGERRVARRTVLRALVRGNPDRLPLGLWPAYVRERALIRAGVRKAVGAIPPLDSG